MQIAPRNLLLYFRGGLSENHCPRDTALSIVEDSQPRPGTSSSTSISTTKSSLLVDCDFEPQNLSDALVISQEEFSLEKIGTNDREFWFAEWAK